MSQQPIIDSYAFVRDSGQIERTQAIASMPRLLSELRDSEGEIHYTLSGKKGDRGQPELVLSIRGRLMLTCQRCLESLPFDLEVDAALELVREDAEIADALLEDDERDFVVASEALDVGALVEDEILLALPLIPMHGDCDLPADRSAGNKPSPFAVLSQLNAASKD